LDYVTKGDENARKALSDNIRDSFDEIKQQQEADELDDFIEDMMEDPEKLPEDLRNELHKMFDDYEAPHGDIPPDAQDSMSPSMDEMKSVEKGQEVVPLYSVEPPIKGLYQGPIYNSFDSTQVRWYASATKQKVKTFNAPETHIMSGKIAGNSTIPIFLPRNYGMSKPNLPSGLVVLRDDNGVFYLQNTNNNTLDYSLGFGRENFPNNTVPTDLDKVDIAGNSLSTATKNYLSKLRGKSNIEKSQAIIHYMKNVLKLEYSNESQYNMIYKKNPAKYFSEIEKHKKVDCDVAQTYFIALCRAAGVPSRMVSGHSVDMVKDGKAIIHQGTGHAWSDIWDENTSSWKTIDATPEGQPEGAGEGESSNAPKEEADIDSPSQEPRDEDEAPSPEEVERSVDENVDKTQNDQQKSDDKQVPDSVREKMKKMKEKQPKTPQDQQPQNDQSAKPIEENEWEESEKQMQEMQKKT